MTKYLNTKPGSVEEVVANMNKNLRQDGAYQDMFKKELDKAGKGIGSMSPKEKKDFFNKIDSKYKAKDEGFASDAQRKAAFASGYKEKGKKEDLDNKDKSVVSKVVTALKKATKAHDGQAKDLEKNNGCVLMVELSGTRSLIILNFGKTCLGMPLVKSYIILLENMILIFYQHI